MAESEKLSKPESTVEDEHSISTTFLWIIKNYAEHHTAEEIASFKIKIQSKDERDWMLKLTKNKSMLEFSIEKITGDSLIKGGEISVSILKKDYNKSDKTSNTLCFDQGNMITFPLIDLVDMELLLHTQDLILLGEICIYSSELKSEKALPALICSSQMCRDLGVLLETKLFYDLSIFVQGEEFRCHKAILCCRSLYFKNLLEKTQKEIVKSGRVVLNWIEANLFRKVLQYIYTSEVEVGDDVFELLAASTEFSLAGLKKICENKLHSYINFQNVVKLYEIACKHKLGSLRERTLYVIAAIVNDEEQNLKESSSNSYKAINTTNQNAICDFEIVSNPSSSGPVSESIGTTKPTKFQTVVGDLSMLSISNKEFLPAVDVWCTTENCVVCSEILKLNVLSSNSKQHCFDDNKNGSKYMLQIIVTPTNYKTGAQTLPKEINGISTLLNNNTDSSYIGLHLSLNLTFSSSVEPNVDIDYSFTIVSENGDEMILSEDFCQLSTHETKQLCMEVNDIPFLKDGNVSLKCKIFRRNGMSHLLRSTPFNLQDDLVKDISSLENDTAFRDMTIKVKPNQPVGHYFYHHPYYSILEFSCHKAIIASRCPFLQCKLEKIGKGNVLALDIEQRHFRPFLSCLYGKDLANRCPRDTLLDLLFVSHTLKVDGLQDSCGNCLIPTLRLENALDTYVISKRYGTDKLQRACVEFISKFFSKLIGLYSNHEAFQNFPMMEMVRKKFAN